MAKTRRRGGRREHFRFFGGSTIPSKPKPQCQCASQGIDKPCLEPTVRGSVFCKLHQNCSHAATNGMEPQYQPDIYNGVPEIQKSHNCFSYAMGVIDRNTTAKCRKNGNCRQYFHQPGALSGQRFELSSDERLTCPAMEKLLLSDFPNMKPVEFEEKCPVGMHKIGLVVSPGKECKQNNSNQGAKSECTENEKTESKDYHFYVLNADGWWSHKPGGNKVIDYDAIKQRIFDPRLASRDYRWEGSDLNYRDFCKLYCVPSGPTVQLGSGGALQAHGASWRDYPSAAVATYRRFRESLRRRPHRRHRLQTRRLQRH